MIQALDPSTVYPLSAITSSMNRELSTKFRMLFLHQRYWSFRPLWHSLQVLILRVNQYISLYFIWQQYISTSTGFTLTPAFINKVTQSMWSCSTLRFFWLNICHEHWTVMQSYFGWSQGFTLLTKCIHHIETLKIALLVKIQIFLVLYKNNCTHKFL